MILVSAAAMLIRMAMSAFAVLLVSRWVSVFGIFAALESGDQSATAPQSVMIIRMFAGDLVTMEVDDPPYGIASAIWKLLTIRNPSKGSRTVSFNRIENPEFMLGRLNRCLVILRGALSPLNDDELDKKMIAALRSTFVSQLLHEHFIVAVAGVQGAGKTTFLRELLMPQKAEQCNAEQTHAYAPGALEWLEPNLGRGEKVPLVVLERQGCDAPEARMIAVTSVENRYEISEQPIEQDAFVRSLHGLQGLELCPLLIVPPTVYGGIDAGFVLLPGYEFMNEGNRAFQEFMRQTLVAAGTAIIVTEKSRLADNRSQKILTDLRENFLGNSRPIVAITHTEYDSDEEREPLRDVACDTFSVPIDERDRVVCVGVGNCMAWRPQLIAALKTFHTVGSQARERQMDYLANTLRSVGEVLNDAERAIRLAGIPAGENDRKVLRVLGFFDRARQSLRKKYAEKLEEAIEGFHSKASEAINAQAKNRPKGLKRITDWGKDLIANDAEIYLEQLDFVKSKWCNSAGQTFAEAHFDVLTRVTAMAYELKGTLELHASAANKFDKQALLAYDGLGDETAHATGNSANALSVRRIDSKVQENLIALFAQDREGLLNLRTNKDLQKAVESLPALVLELGRMASLSEDVRLKLESSGRPDVVAIAADMEKDFGSLAGTASTVIRGLAVMLGIDFAADGKIDTIPALWKALAGATGTDSAAAGTATAAGMAAAPAAAAVSGALFVAGALVAVISAAVVLNQIKRGETGRQALGHQIASALSDAYRERCLTGFDGAMDFVRERLACRLEQRYHLDEALGQMDRQGCALGGARSALGDLQEALGERVPGLA